MLRDFIDRAETVSSGEVELTFDKVDHEFVKLWYWREVAMDAIMNHSDVVQVYVSHRENRLVVGLEEARFEASSAEIQDIASSVGVPDGVLLITPTGPIRLDIGVESTSEYTAGTGNTLRDKERPLTGGLKITRIDSDGTVQENRWCTYFGNVRWHYFSQRAFLTNSHCTEVWWSTTASTGYYQSHPDDPGYETFIGNEASDPERHRCGSFWRHRCRYSDAAVWYARGGASRDEETIARPEGPPGYGRSQWGSINIDQQQPRFDISGQRNDPLDWQTVHKVGAKSGWTSGELAERCVDVRTTDGTRLRCTFRATYASAGGDSGSPVFHRLRRGDTVEVFGIHWGSDLAANQALFSSLWGINQDIGGVRVVW